MVDEAAQRKERRLTPVQAGILEAFGNEVRALQRRTKAEIEAELRELRGRIAELEEKLAHAGSHPISD